MLAHNPMATMRAIIMGALLVWASCHTELSLCAKSDRAPNHRVCDWLLAAGMTFITISGNIMSFALGRDRRRLRSRVHENSQYRRAFAGADRNAHFRRIMTGFQGLVIGLAAG